MRNWETPGVPVPGARFYDEILPGVVAELAGDLPYWPGSPFGGNDHNSMLEGDRHNWDVWHGNSPRRFGEPFTSDTSPAGVDFRRYAEDMGRFISEFGMHAAPVRETLRRVIPEDQLFRHSESMDHHNKDNPKNKGDNLMVTVTGLPEDLDEYVDFSMIAQAQGLKFGIEHYRRRAPHCSGTLIWQLNDCWPVLSWSIVDYYGFEKAGYFATKRVYAPVLASFRTLPDGGAELWVSNDSRDPVDGEATVALRAFGGEVIWEQAVPVRAEAGASVPVARWPADEAAPGPDRYLSVRSADGAFAPNRHFFVAIKDLVREVPEVESAVKAVDDHTLEVTLSAAAFACFVHLIVPHEATRFDDNYFDLEPGERRTVTVTNPEVALTPDMVTVRSR
jgi:beta-mannosidase